MTTYIDRINAARNSQSSFSAQVVFSLVDHAKWQLNEDNAAHEDWGTPQHQVLARHVLNNPDGYAWRFGAWVITQPQFAPYDPNGLADSDVLAAVAAAWRYFAPVPSE